MKEIYVLPGTQGRELELELFGYKKKEDTRSEFGI